MEPTPNQPPIVTYFVICYLNFIQKVQSET
jgi:hypothetical protein